ncbi:hypothetical protein BV898_01419 [Hypsibius exemplaris]|uniref:NodB homology domain-containing protein n=1 Tax=Hypsibius exemplaris TaxID=2072580 RepID=A0A1W0XC41_HYPEX|nr:hypothetical protein BV898_01419 [Hypsibius exemplaris]
MMLNTRHLAVICGMLMALLLASFVDGSLKIVDDAVHEKTGADKSIKASVMAPELLSHSGAPVKNYVPTEIDAPIIPGANVTTMVPPNNDRLLSSAMSSNVSNAGSAHPQTTSHQTSTMATKTTSINPANATNSPGTLHRPTQPKSSMRNTIEPATYGTRAVKCDYNTCKLPNCLCGGTSIPGSLPPSETPQIVMITFDDAVTFSNNALYKLIFSDQRRNPNGCPIRGTFYVSHEWTDYNLVQNLYSSGHEIASHSISHPFPGRNFTQQDWTDEIEGQREILTRYGNVKRQDIRGMRAPFLQTGGDSQFDMLWREGFTYDSSMSVYQNKPPMWPFTLDHAIPFNCQIGPCPTKSYPGLWEMPLVQWNDLVGMRCAMVDGCHRPANAEQVYQLLMSNFKRHYESNRAPFGLYYHATWFQMGGFDKFLDAILTMPDVWVVTTSQALQWIRNPTPLSEISRFAPWKCSNNFSGPRHACSKTTFCPICFQGRMRSINTCAASCPTSFPGIKNKNLFTPVTDNASTCSKPFLVSKNSRTMN